jgi:hypothetical protein
MVIKRLNIFF